MPWYDFKCPECGFIGTLKFSYDEYDSVEKELYCSDCTDQRDKWVRMVRSYSQIATTNMPTRAGRRLGKTARK